ncbi:MAG: NYN domain-containing protein [Desulfotomaculum sp.]|nr:NYN domain-containing protein [Desulfotomaculum sp.]
MANHYIIDGYNVIHAWPDFQKTMAAAFEHTRERLIAMASEFMASTGEKVIIVFDAHLVPAGYEHVEQADNVKIYYTKHGQTADAMIEKLVGKINQQGTVYVVTSDWDEQRVIFGRGAYRLTPGEFRHLIERAQKESHNHMKKITPAENYLENRLQSEVRAKLEQIRRQK